MARHELKIKPKYFDAVTHSLKTFEVRENDRDFNVGDTLVLEEWDEMEYRYTGRKTEVIVCYMLDSVPGLDDSYCVLGIKYPRDFSYAH